MPAILVLDDEQAKIVHETPETIEVRDRSGNHLGYVSHGFTPEDLAIAQQRRRSSEARHSTEQVIKSLSAEPFAKDVPKWWNIYEGLSKEEIDRLDQAIRPRANLTRHFE